MVLDPRIILAGESPDIIGSLSRGIAAGQQSREAQAKNALADLYRTQGPGIAAGDPGALNALAMQDPMAAMGVQNAQLGMQQTRAQMGYQAEAAKRAAAEYARQVGAEKAQAEAAELERILRGAAAMHAQGNQAGYEAWLSQNGADPAQYPFEQFPAVAAQFGGVLDVLKQMTPAQMKPDDRFKVVGNQIFDLTAQGGPAKVAEAPGQTETIYGPDGQPIVSRGPAKPFTEAQSKDNVFVTRAEGALAALDPVAGELTSVTGRAAEMDPTGIVRGAVQSDAFQLAKQAGDEFLQAILRKDTGAAITEQEQALYGTTYLPRPGDSAAVLEAKRAARARAVEAMRSGMSIDQVTATERALVAAAERVGATPSAGGAAPAQPGQARRLRFNPATGDFE